MLHASVLVSMAWGRNGGLSALDPVSTTLDTRSRQVLFNLRDQQMLAGGALFEVGYGSNRTFLRQEPKGRAPYLSTPEGRGGNHYFDGRQESSRDQVLANLFLPVFSLAGAHQVKTGVGVDWLGYDQEIGRTEIRLFDAALAPIRTIAFEGSGTLSASNVEVGAYVQDTWRLSSRVVAQLGVRADWDDLVSAWGASPRLGIAWSPFGDDDTRVSGGYAIARDATRLHLFSRADDQTPINTFYSPLARSFRSTFVIPDRLSNPYARTWSLTIDRRLPSNLLVRAQAFDRRSTNGLSFFGTPSSERDTTYTLANARRERYRSVEASVRQTIRQEYGWSASYTRSRVTSNAVVDVSPGDYVLAAHNDGPLDWDAPNRVVAWFYLPTVIRPKWAIAGFIDYRSGFPFSALDDAGFVVGSANAFRYPSHFELDLAIERRITLRRHHWALRVGVDNITNHFNPTTVNANIASDRFGQFYGGQDRLLIARLRWLGRSK
jgi:outer membrane receptor protein involved in Fe transport